MPITISVLDQSIIFDGERPEDAFANTIKLAQKSEELGFKRYWVAEHHDSERVAGSSPEVLISHLLAKTERIRIGSGGVMLQHYSPYKVAENFNVLAALAPGRVDLGIGRAPGGLRNSTKALQRGVGSDSLSLGDKISELAKHVYNRLEDDHPLTGVKATPIPATAPEIYILGASVGSAELAAQLGLPYVYSLILNNDHAIAQEAIQAYRSGFQAVYNAAPEAILALSVVVAETEEEAELLAPVQKLYRVNLAGGGGVSLDTWKNAEEYGKQSGEAFTVEEKVVGTIKGTKASVRTQLLELQEATGISEFVVTTNISPFNKRLHSLELLNEALSEVPQEV